METRADALYGARLRVQSRLLVPLVALKNVALGALGWLGDGVAPAVVEVHRLDDGTVVGTVDAGSGYGDQAGLLEQVQRSLADLAPEDFLETWRLSR